MKMPKTQFFLSSFIFEIIQEIPSIKVGWTLKWMFVFYKLNLAAFATVLIKNIVLFFFFLFFQIKFKTKILNSSVLKITSNLLYCKVILLCYLFIVFLWIWVFLLFIICFVFIIWNLFEFCFCILSLHIYCFISLMKMLLNELVIIIINNAGGQLLRTTTKAYIAKCRLERIQWTE